jgi:quercetin dioxygenase-like cupin family protein
LKIRYILYLSVKILNKNKKYKKEGKMKIVDYKEVKAEAVDFEDVKDVKVRWLISDKDKAPNFAMRLFEVGPGGYSPLHTHNWEHEVFILEGEGVANNGEKETKLKSGTVVYVAPNEKHQFKNTGSETLKFLCLIPIKK